MTLKNRVVAACVAVGTISAPLIAEAQSALTERDLAVVRLNIVDLLANEPGLPLPVRQRHEELAEYYGTGGGDLLWLGTGRAGQLVARLGGAESDGLDPDDYPTDQLAALEQAITVADRRGRAIIELHFSAAFLEYAGDMKVGRFLPRKVDPNFFLQGRSIEPLTALEGLAVDEDVDGFFDGWEPQSPYYQDLKSVLLEYRAIAQLGGWPKVPLGDTLKPGMDDPRVGILRARLAVTDGAPQPGLEGADVYDDALAETVRSFQKRHGLEVDAAVGPATIVALNVPVERRIEELKIAMERWRWMPEDLGDDHILVNIAGFELRRWSQGREEERMNVVVGKPYHRTPVFSDQIKYLEFNPYWNVPSSITFNEELPKLQSDPAGRAAAGFEAVQGDQVYDLRSIDWRRYGPGNFPFRIRQRPGDNNALGRVKFMFPNEHNVYLHDTPARSLFGRAERAFSHGCIRLARPLDLADQVLRVGGVEGWNASRVDSVVASRNRTVVNLAKPLPVHITYLTAWVDGGDANFRNDIYNHDEKLLAALDGRALSW